MEADHIINALMSLPWGTIGGTVGVLLPVLTFVAGRRAAEANVRKTLAEAQEIRARARKTEAESKALLEAADDPEERLQKKIMAGFSQLADSYETNLKRIETAFDATRKEMQAQGEELHRLRQDNITLSRNVQILTEENRGLVRQVADLQLHIDVLVTAMHEDDAALPTTVPKRLVDKARVILADAGDCIPTKMECATCRYNKSCEGEPALQLLRLSARLCRPASRREENAVVISDIKSLGDAEV